MTAATLMIMGTSSSAGKSLLTAGLCRCFARRGIRVAPFKAQNMSNNASVCLDGGEIGRSQALQALAAGVVPSTDMNPILLKPESDSHSQIIVNGRPWRSLGAMDYFERKRELWPIVTGALERLRSGYELVIIEGAGSPAELNLSDVEIVNMSVARHCNATVVLVGDIERGGVFAQLLGTLWLLSPEDRKLVQGLVINKFRGDLRLFDEGRAILEQRSGLPVLGVLPWLDDLRLPQEDAEVLSQEHASISGCMQRTWTDLHVAVVRLPHISNFDDFDPLKGENGVSLYYASSIEQLGRPDVVVLPGTKNTLGDLQWLRVSGLAERIVELSRRGASIVGICGGYQMLGTRLHNPQRLENDCEFANGLGLLDCETVFKAEKRTCQVVAEVSSEVIASGLLGQKLSGYEIHSGRTTSKTAWLRRTESGNGVLERLSDVSACDGAYAKNGRVWGCYLHGLFHNDAFRTTWLDSLGVPPSFKDLQLASNRTASATIQLSLDRLADAIEANMNLDQLEQLIWNSERIESHV